MSAATMRRFAGRTLGSLADFAIEHVPVPQPGPGEVLIQIEVTGLGYVDALIAEGRYQLKPPLPYVPGGEIAGRVAAIGPGVTGLSVGDPVVTWQLGGGAADYCLVKATDVGRRPLDLGGLQAAAILIDGMTARYGLFDRGKLQWGETVLVLGAAGGVGSAAVRIAVEAGAFVVAAVSSEAKAAAARLAGAHATVDYTNPEWRQALTAAIPGAGVDLVFDPVGGATFEPAFRSLAKGGRHLVVGFAGGAIPALPANLALLKSASLVGVDVRHFHERKPDDARRERDVLLDLAARNVVQAPNILPFPLDQAREAFATLKRRDKLGKVVLVP